MLTSWVLFPLVLAALCVGWGWLLVSVLRVRIPGALVPCLGMAGLVVVGQFPTYADFTAGLTTPLLTAGAAVGLVLGVRRALSLPPAWALVAAGGVLAVYAAPIVLSGEATFAGFIKLDDTATWMAFTDQLMEHGRDLDGLAPSTYEATLSFNIGDGYPTGVFVPLGVGTALVGEDVAWLVQPYMAVWAALLAIALYALARRAVRGPRSRAAVAFVAAQPALLFGYYLWGGIKEVAAIALIGTTAALLPLAVRPGPVRRVAPAALTASALIGVLSAGGIVWLGPMLLAAVIVCAWELGRRPALVRAALFAGITAVAAVPVLMAGAFLPPTSSPLTAAGALGNLGDPLELAQIAGVWPAGDFRSYPDAELLAYVAVAVIAIAAAGGLAVTWRRRAWWAFGFIVGTLLAALGIWLVGSPWVDAKALATASVAVPFAALVAALAAWATGRRVLGAGLALLVFGGVAWSNVLAYRDVNLAPRERLAELERIGEQIEGEGPTLMTEYNPYGARHFLREGGAEGVSELRRRGIPLADGDPVRKGHSADTDELDPDDLLVYRSLVLRRSPVRSRPPSPYGLAWRGRWYELWQRPEQIPDIERLALGTTFGPAGVPDCREVLALAEGATAGERLIAAEAPEPILFGIADHREGTIEVGQPGPYSVWILGSVRGSARAVADGEATPEVRHQLNHEGGYVYLGHLDLDAGESHVRVELGGADLHPGSGGPRGLLGPLALVPETVPAPRLVSVAPQQARDLCGRPWDWIELAGAIRP
ncbi:MAG: hypothetical protein ACHQCI_00285 [Solirubrobacterales bacterium]